MKLTVGTSVVQVARRGTSRQVVQNLGPGMLYYDTVNSVSPETGLELEVGAVFEYLLPAKDDVFLIASQPSTDVRMVDL